MSHGPRQQQDEDHAQHDHNTLERTHAAAHRRGHLGCGRSYGAGNAEMILGRALAGRDDAFKVMTEIATVLAG
jgi:hypothetical protein